MDNLPMPDDVNPFLLFPAPGEIPFRPFRFPAKYIGFVPSPCLPAPEPQPLIPYFHYPPYGSVKLTPLYYQPAVFGRTKEAQAQEVTEINTESDQYDTIGQYNKTQKRVVPKTPSPAYGSIVSVMERGYNPFHVVFGEEFIPLGEFDENQFWGTQSTTDPAEAFVSTHGVIHVKLRLGFRMDLSINKAIRIVNEKTQIAMAVGADGKSMSLIHPMGCVLQDDQKIDIKVNNCPRELLENPKYARINESGIVFKSRLSPLGFRVDQGGVRSAIQRRYNTFDTDLSVSTFYEKAVSGPTYLESAAMILQGTARWEDYWGVDHWCVNGLHITQTFDGTVTVKFGPNDEYEMRTSDLCGTCCVSTAAIYCTASVGGYNAAERVSTGPHFFVKTDGGVKRVFADLAETSFRVGSQTAKMDMRGNLMMLF